MSLVNDTEGEVRAERRREKEMIARGNGKNASLPMITFDF